ncbi:MAG: hypothetical protein ACREFW_01450 [Rhizomicrobium sp.]
MHAAPGFLRYLVPIVVILPLLYLRLRRMMRPVPLKLNRMWIRPGIFFLSAIAVLAAAPPPVATWPWFFLTAALGGALGWQWGRLMAIQVDPANGTLMTRGSQAALIMMVLLLAIRSGLRAGMRIEGAALHLDAALVTDIFIVFGAFLFGMRGIEMFLRARRVVARSSAE